MTLRRIATFVIAFLLVVSLGHASTSIYKSPNKIDSIKTGKAKKNEKEGGLNHPYTFSDEQIRSILGSFRFNKKIIILKDVENRQLFDEKNVEFLAPYLIEAFQKVKPEEVVVVSYFTRDSKFVIQDDRLTVFRAFVKNDGLHVKFTKLYAKMLGDRTTMGATRATQEARSLRVGLEIQPGQNQVSWDPEELVVDLNHFSKEGVVVDEKKPESKKEKKGKIVQKTKTATATSDANTEDNAEKFKSIRERLKELDQLKKDEMITGKEYERKRKELLKEL